MSDTEVGKLLEGGEERDAIHIAVASVKAASKLKPGQHVGVLNGEASDVVSNKIGIVDPFLAEKEVKPGQHFWLWLYPRTITSLKHNWEHPEFPAETGPRRSTETTAASEVWLRDFCSANGPGWDAVRAALENDGRSTSVDDYNFVRVDGNYLHSNGTDAHGEIPAEFWLHVENVLGRYNGPRPDHFSCSC